MNFPKTFEHSDKYQDGKYEYKHIILNKEVFDKLPKYKILSESEWRAIGIVQTKGGFTTHFLDLSLISYCFDAY